MAKNALLLHDTSATPRANWIPWLGNQLQWRGWSVAAPQLPEADKPDIDRYWAALSDYPFDHRTVIVGHGSGAVAGFICLHRLVENLKIHRLVSVAGFYRDAGFDCENLFTEEYDWRKIARQTEYVDLLWSPQDPYVSEEQTTVLSKQLEVKPQIFEGYGHFAVETNRRFRQFPELLDIVLQG